MKLAYYTGIRRGEILKLTWGMVDLKGEDKGIILPPEVCITNEGRFVPLNVEMVETFKAMPQSLPGVPVLPRQGSRLPVQQSEWGFKAACKSAEIVDFNFHDLRHALVTNMRRAGVHEPVIMKITGHKTRAMFDRYNSVSREEVKAAVKASEKPVVHQNVHQTAG